MTCASEITIEHNAPIPTWFGVGGGADRLVRPESPRQVRQCIETDPDLRVLGEGANLLVDDAGVGELVMATGRLRGFEIDGTRLVARAGEDLAKVIRAAINAGLGGLEGLGGIPASIGGAVVMNAGGRFGQIADVVREVHGFDRAGNPVSLERSRIEFGYRRSGLGRMVITEVEFELDRDGPGVLRDRLKEVMRIKKQTQPLAEKSAGCVFKNPVLKHDVEGIGRVGQRVGAGLVIDRAGCKGLAVGSASVSDRHANFIVLRRDSGIGNRQSGGRGGESGIGNRQSGGRGGDSGIGNRQSGGRGGDSGIGNRQSGGGGGDMGRVGAGDVMALMDLVSARVLERFGVVLESELVVWRRGR